VPDLHLVDGTYELFRSYFGAPPHKAPDGRDVGASRGVIASMIYMLRSEGATHVACATDHVIRSFRNELFPGYKTDEGVPKELLDQFPLIEELMRALGLVVWPMVEFEADDALAAGAALFADKADRVIIATVDKDLAQCVRGDRVIMLDRRRKSTLDEAGVRAKFGVEPRQIADYLALVGDTADGYPGIPGFGGKGAAALLASFARLEDVPLDPAKWPRDLRGALRLAATFAERREDALLYKRLATLRTDVPISESFEDLEWRGARPALRELTKELGFPDVCERVPRWNEAG
jgi:5'-3' exonuclease